MTDRHDEGTLHYTAAIRQLRELARREYGDNITTETMLWEDGSFYVKVFHSWDRSYDGRDFHDRPLVPRSDVEYVFRERWQYDSEDGYTHDTIRGPEGLATKTVVNTESMEGPA